MVYGIGRIDASGRVADRMVAGVLGWRCGDRLTLTAEAGVVIARPLAVVDQAIRAHGALPCGEEG